MSRVGIIADVLYTGVIVAMSCGECGVVFGLEQSYRNERLKNHELNWYCPNGHGRAFTGETDAQKYKRELDYANDARARLTAERDQIEASRRAYKGQATKLRNRAIAGECPICGQHLRDLTRHMGRVHPDERPEAET